MSSELVTAPSELEWLRENIFLTRLPVYCAATAAAV